MSDYQFKDSISPLRSKSPSLMQSMSTSKPVPADIRSNTAVSDFKNKPTKKDSKDKEFTEIFSWGNDKSGQLGLGQRLSQGK